MKNLLNYLRDKVYVPVASQAMWLNSVLINSTVKLTVVNEEVIPRLHQNDGRIVFAFWHQATFTLFNYYRKQKICAMPVDNYLGNILKGFFRKYGFNTVTYPESGTPIERVQAISRVIKTIKEGWDFGVAVDGPPKEELFKAKPGVFFLAQRTGYPVVPAGVYYEKAWRFDFRWDKYLVPKLFSKAVLVLGEPIYVNEKLSEKELEPMVRALEKKLHALTEKARKICLSK